MNTNPQNAPTAARGSSSILDAIRRRASAVKLGPPGPTPEQLETILKAGATAPDHGRLAPWRFVVLRGDAIGILGNAMADLRRRSAPDSTEEQIEKERQKPRRAPAIVAVAAHVVTGHKVPEIEQVLAVAACVENMFLAANALGVGVMWKTGAAAYDAGVKEALGLDATDRIVAFLYLGTPVVPGTPREATAERATRWL